MNIMKNYNDFVMRICHPVVSAAAVLKPVIRGITGRGKPIQRVFSVSS